MKNNYTPNRILKKTLLLGIVTSLNFLVSCSSLISTDDDMAEEKSFTEVISNDSLTLFKMTTTLYDSKCQGGTVSDCKVGTNKSIYYVGYNSNNKKTLKITENDSLFNSFFYNFSKNSEEGAFLNNFEFIVNQGDRSADRTGDIVIVFNLKDGSVKQKTVPPQYTGYLKNVFQHASSQKVVFDISQNTQTNKNAESKFLTYDFEKNTLSDFGIVNRPDSIYKILDYYRYDNTDFALVQTKSNSIFIAKKNNNELEVKDLLIQFQSTSLQDIKGRIQRDQVFITHDNSSTEKIYDGSIYHGYLSNTKTIKVEKNSLNSNNPYLIPSGSKYNFETHLNSNEVEVYKEDVLQYSIPINDSFYPSL